MAKIISFISSFTKFALFAAIGGLSLIVIINPNIPFYVVRWLTGLIGVMLLMNYSYLTSISFIDSMRKDLKLIEFQNAILNEIKNGNTKVMEFMTNQADALSKMTRLAVKKSENENVRS